ncbi:MAG: pentapeptide repeat-containing protein, partial [Dehalococcoidia bacterium]
MLRETQKLTMMPRKTEKLTAQQLLAAYKAGRREFHYVQADNADLAGTDLRAASFYYASLRGANLSDASLTFVQFKGADLTEAVLSGSQLNATDLIAANFHNADMRQTDLTGAALARADCTGADMRRAHFGSASLGGASFQGARLDRASFGSTHFDDVDVRPFCGLSTLKHHSPSYIDSRTVMKSYSHPALKRFMVDCGVPEIFAEYMIDCAKAIELPLLRRMMQTTFISYGAPDETFADNEVFRRIQEHDRVLLVCSRNSLDRDGVLNEIQETLDREARDGGATYLLPITLDDY